MQAILLENVVGCHLRGSLELMLVLGFRIKQLEADLDRKKTLFRHEDLALFRIAGEVTPKNGSNSPTNPFKWP